MNDSISTQHFQETEDFVIAQLRAEFGKGGSPVTASDMQLANLAAKVLVPIVIALSGQSAFDLLEEWKAGKLTKVEVLFRLATPLPTESTGQPVTASPPGERPVKRFEQHIDQQQVIRTIIAGLQGEGLAKEQAGELIRKTLEKLGTLNKEGA